MSKRDHFFKLNLITNQVRNVILLFTLLFVFTSKIWATDNTPQPRPNRAVVGRVIDKKTESPVEYATVALYQMPGKKLVTGVVTNQKGVFMLKGVKNGSYQLEIKYIGYDKHLSKQFHVTDQNNFIRIGQVILAPNAKLLNEVEVVGNNRNIEYKIDKKVVNVSKQLTATAGTAVDVLENVPSVTVDVNGDVSLRGSTSFTVLIDGKPTVLDANDALKQIPSASIQNIELITNPSVKYDPDGTSGIINIITKKNKLTGISGMASLSGGTFDNYNGNLLLNWRKNDFNFTLGGNFRNGNFPYDTENRRETFSNDTTWVTSSYGEGKRNYSMQSFNAGVEWNFSDKDMLSVSGRFGQFNMNMGSDLTYTELVKTSKETISEKQYLSSENADRQRKFYSVNTTYTHDFAKKGHQIEAQFNAMQRDAMDDSGSILTDMDGKITDGKNNSEDGPSKRYVTKIDYTLPLANDSKFEAGFQSRVQNSTDDTKLYNYDVASGDYVIDNKFSRVTDYQRDIYSMYAQYNTQIDKFGVQAGFREEYTDRVISSDTDNSTATVRRWDWFPTLHLSYNITDNDQLMTSYTKRIKRTRGYYLEPFITWVDNFNVRQGNPNLIPELIDSYEVTYLKDFGRNFLSVDLYYRVTHNKVEQIESVYDENIIMRTPENIGQDYSFGTEITLGVSPFKWWKINLMGNLYDYRVEGQLNDQDFSRSSFNWTGRFNNTFIINKTTSFQINNTYQSGSVTAQGSKEGYYSMNIAARKSFFDRKLNATIQMRNALNTINYESYSEAPGLTTYNSTTYGWPMVNLTLSYTFNNFKRSMKKRGEGSSDMDMEGF
ncbi:TonB-dependent receptor [Halosquirtibacter xylanolyticus]|uniref:TonB-dependent receptor domain-containing protein n=1 Tax=Halosquirtibacter xylanolyticus TaxID=3374599 RepID=UPI0037489531|nr:TonB-dependent receptor [Prolixibacteraceae bacterium]